MGVLAALVVVLGVGAWLTSRGGSGNSSSGTAATSSSPADAGPKAGDVQKDRHGGLHGRGGRRRQLLCRPLLRTRGGSPCRPLTAPACPARSTPPQLKGGKIVVSLSRARMPDVGTGRALQALADTDGTGNVNDLLREGVR